MAAVLEHPTTPQKPDAPIKEAPNNLEAEQAVLGAILANNDALNQIENLDPEDFYAGIHQRIFKTIRQFNDKGLIANPVTLKHHFAGSEGVEDHYLARLVGSATSVINMRDYARVIRDLAIKRRLIGVGEGVVNEVYNPENHEDGITLVERAEQQLFKLATDGDAEGGFKPLKHSVVDALNRTEKAFQRNGEVVGLDTGFRDMNKLLGGLHPADLLILAGRPAMGKAQPLDAKVLTETGWKAMGELKFGEKLASIDGAPSKVTGLFPQGARQVYRVTFSDGRSTECCDEHLWQVHYRAWEAPRILATAKLREMLTRKRYQNRLWFEPFSGQFGTAQPHHLPVDPWVLGALIGDGKLSGSSPMFSSADPEILERLSYRLEGELEVAAAGNYDYRIRTVGGSHRAGVQGVMPNMLKENLAALGLWDIRSEDKFIPETYLQSNREARLELLRGLMDTDGWIERWGSVRFCTSSMQLAQDVVTLVRSLGGRCSLASKAPTYTYRGVKKQGLPAYVLNIQYAQPDALFTLPRKRARLGQITKQKRITFAAIAPTRTTQTQCISVSHPSRLYITDDYIVTHNTALATTIAQNAAKAIAREDEDALARGEKPRSVGFFSLEMSGEQLAMRLLASACGVGSHKLQRGDLSQDEFNRLVESSSEMARLPLHIDDTPALTIGALRSRARRLKRVHNLSLLVIDYLQLVRPSSSGSQMNRVQEVSEITQGLKAIAKELDIPVIALSQLSRQVESRDDKRPQLADLRESGSIEQDADIVMFVFREEYYKQRLQPKEGTPEHATWMQEMAEIHGVAEVIVAKHRNGPVDTVKLQFQGELTRFLDLVKDDHLPEQYY